MRNKQLKLAFMNSYNQKKITGFWYKIFNLQFIENILDNGEFIQSRNGTTKNIFGGSMRFSLKNGSIPFLTTKKLAWKTCLKELLWFISGDTNNKTLLDQNVHIGMEIQHVIF